MALHLSAFDIVALLLIALGGLSGLSRGFVTEVLSLLGWVAGFAAVHYLYAPGKAIATRFTGTEAGGAVLAFAVIFLTAFFVVRAIATSIGGQTRNSLLGPFDRLLGLGFGGLKGLLAASVLFLAGTMVFDVVDPGLRPEWLRPVRTAPLIEAPSKAMVDFVEQRRARAAIANAEAHKKS
ncbi:CvpA family protein [Sphingosinicellaceae bacterium]|nr:CvpA family protein [Sphingosinicellaceae bacterium]